MRLVWSILLGSIILILFALGIFLLIPFPIAIFQSIVDSQVYLQHKTDGQFPTATYYWSRIPATQYWTFNLFNITNPDEVLYYGATPNLLERGPYVYAETEFKDFIEFRDNDNTIFYQNNKTWIFDQSRSCENCFPSDTITFGNTAYMSLVFMNIEQPGPAIVATGMDVLAILLGEQPLRSVNVAGTLFTGYSDPLIDLMNSQFTKVLMAIFGNPIQFPQVVTGGFFPDYNHTCDGSYTLKTGKDKVENTALIQTWNDMSNLPWWKSPKASDIRNTGDGTFQKPGLTKTDTLKQFQSFVCRTYNLHYSESTYTTGIPTYGFKIEDDCYDAVRHEEYRYPNLEKKNYFPNWPCGLNHTKSNNANCALIDCSKQENFCNLCCDGSHIGDTYLLPPGMVPQQCIPGQNIPLPFGAILSAPHFFGAPDSIYDNFIGLNPNADLHHPGTFYINPTVGSSIGGKFRMQLSLPMFASPLWTTMSNMKNTIIPAFWLNIGVEMKDYAHDYVYFNVVTIPNIVLGLGIGFTAISLIALVVWGFCYFRRKQRVSSSKPVFRITNRADLDYSWETN